MKTNKLVLGIIGALMMLVCTFFLAFLTVRDYYFASEGLKVRVKVTDNSNVCNRWNKYVLVEYKGEEYNIHVYGLGCRYDEFPPNQLINVRSNKSGDLLVLESNHYIFRTCFMVLIFLLSAFVNVLMFNQYLFWKKARIRKTS